MLLDSFMTIPEAANLVLQVGKISTGGEVFILNMGEQVKIYDLATRLIHFLVEIYPQILKAMAYKLKRLDFVQVKSFTRNY